jgi:beta-lactamase regulating signal transducer with metallopeptidase domain
MIEHAATLLLRLSLEFSLTIIALLALRPWLRRAYGAACAYASWALLPLMLVVAQLPASRPAQAVQGLVAREWPVHRALPAVLAPDAPLDWAAPLLVAWFAGAVVCGLVLAVRQRRFMRGLQRDAEQEGWRAPAGSGPALVGVWRPRLCLPADFGQRFTPDQQSLILAHEEVHRIRRDNLWNLLATLVATLQWFNPLAWIGLRVMRVDQELSCDAAVLRGSRQFADYAHALLNAQPAALQAGGIHSSWRSAHPLVERISMLKLHAHARRRAGLITLALLGALGAGVVHAWQAEASSQAALPDKADVRLAYSLQYFEPRPEPEHVQKWRTSGVVDLAQGKPYRITLGEADPKQRLEYTMTAAPHGAGQWDIKIQLRGGESLKTMASPRLILPSGEPGTIDSSFDGGSELIAFIVPTTLRNGQPVLPIKP